MTQRKLPDKFGATPGKLALIGLLAVVLIWVIVRQLPGSSAAVETVNSNSGQATSVSASPKSASTQQVVRRRSAKVISSSNKQSPIAGVHQSWPKLRMDAVLAADPFAAPQWFTLAVREKAAQDLPAAADDKQEEIEKSLEEFRKQGAAIVVISNRDKMATLGSHEVRIGDVVDGFIVTNISTEGVVLTELRKR